MALKDCLPDLKPKNTLLFLQLLPGAKRDFVFSSLDRDRLFKLVKDKFVNTPTLCALILSWGGMRPQHFKALIRQTEWVRVCDKIRAGCLTRREAYADFLALRKAGKLQGMGPAFFTKLIYFLAPRSDGVRSPHIMDQWAASSMNVLCGRKVVKLSASGKSLWVNDANDPECYEVFCELVDRLCVRLKVDPHRLDRAMLSLGGRNPHPWRSYVISHRN